MDLKRFELTMEKFFQKAGVSLLKKNQNYEGYDETAPYILLDSKRKTYYLTETDNYDSNALPDMELEAAATYFADKEKIPQHSSKAILALGRSVTFFSEDFKLPDTDMMQLTRKSALVISEENADVTKNYLTQRGITFQSVPFKGAFLVMFIDRASSEQISDIYQSVSNEYMQGTPGEQPQETPADPIPANSLSFEDLLKGIPEPEDDDEKPEVKITPVPKSEPVVTNEPVAKKQPTEPSDEEMLDNIDLSFIQKAVEAPKMTEEEGDLLYSKLINEQAESAHNAPSPRARNREEIPADVFTSLDKDIKQEQAEPTKEEAPEKEETPEPEKPAVKVKSKAKKVPDIKADVEGERELSGVSASKIASNTAGVLFFAPAYILNKLLSRIMPPFVIYWLAAIAMMFGLYQIVFSFVSPFFYPAMTDWAREVAGYTAEFINVSGVLSPIDSSANDIITLSLIFFTGQGASVSAAENSWLLRYMASFGTLLMIFPLSRRFGARIVIFSLLMFFALPFILGAEAYIINILTGTAAEALQLGSGTQARMVLASGAIFAVFAVPMIIIAAVYWIAGYFIPDSSTHKEVLP